MYQGENPLCLGAWKYFLLFIFSKSENEPVDSQNTVIVVSHLQG